ncbi:hypothetical protein CFP56_011372 [Quercus suber]|uniref:Uncharacterized protein n=1 Tax=Quercus suber TaxID=58331 RepID=A0AAW0MCB5_QUESU
MSAAKYQRVRKPRDSVSLTHLTSKVPAFIYKGFVSNIAPIVKERVINRCGTLKEKGMYWEL